MKITFISWAPYCSRSDNLARELGGVSHMVYWRRLGSRAATIGLKYLGQTAATWWILARARPTAVFVMSPPVFAVLAVWCYCRPLGVPYVIDSHTAAYLHPRWRRFQQLQRALCRRAATTIVTNEHLAGVLRGWGADASIIRDVPIVFSKIEPIAGIGERMSVAVVCSFNADEPYLNVIDAAREVPDVDFFLTGDPSKADGVVVRSAPPNVRFTGFLSDAAYAGLLTSASVVLTLTTRDHTMLRGAYEAVYQGTPVIVSDWPILKAAFSRGAVHVNNSVAQIVSAIRDVQRAPQRLRAEVLELRDLKYREWGRARQALLERLAGADGGRPSTPSRAHAPNGIATARGAQRANPEDRPPAEGWSDRAT